MRKRHPLALALLLTACADGIDRDEVVDTTLPNSVAAIDPAAAVADNLEMAADNLEAMADTMTEPSPAMSTEDGSDAMFPSMLDPDPSPTARETPTADDTGDIPSDPFAR